MNDPHGVMSKASAANSALFEGIVTSAMDAVIAVDAQFRIIAFNGAAEAMFGVRAADVLGHSLDRFIPERYHESHRRHLERYAATGETHRRMGALGGVRAVRSNGEEFTVEASISQSVVDGERVFSVILRDIGQEAADAEKMVLAREVDHRAKNILAIVSSLISLTTGPTQADYVRALSGRVAALSRANSLLSVERWKGAPLIGLVRGELDAHGAGREVSLAGPDLLLDSRAVQPLAMLLHELSSNAVRHGAFSCPGGKVEVQWGEEANGGLFLRWQEQGGPTVTAPAKPGLGLTLLQQIVDIQMAGQLSLDWRAGGLVFEARFPAIVAQHLAGERDGLDTAPLTPAPTPGPEAEPGKTAAAHDPNGTLLIVEDEPILAMQLSRALSGLGWKILGVAGSIDAANRLLAEHPRPDVAILDVDLGGTPVFPLARALRHSGIPFLFCTGYEDVAYNREFSDCIVVRKPATALQIVAGLRRTVHAASHSAR